ncbi:oligosaccharide flippase family protein [Kineothrix sp. MSJ-39]|uniref:lipopolysaccharide biosynthesis protein n=1 Tax=Kineothrix sp. MSJ-39 TaxID=2841533 RepID=UPI001C0F7E3B|nr:oligosaccharide flippase family protein [Kineothrix sp. MSJ-39]MBU5430218.1 oligosaccharide flippase family protein [Kineothrix sp. MSJ-39]
MKKTNMLFQSKDNLLHDIIYSGLCKPISMVISYIYVPIIMNYLGVERYGIWTTIMSILSWISFFDIGIGNGLRNKLTDAIALKENEKEKKLISSAYAFIATIMILAITVFCAVAIQVDWNRVFGITNIDENLTVVVCISAIFMVLNFILSICKNIIYALQKAAYASVMELVTQILSVLGVLIIMRVTPGNLFSLALIYGLSMTIVNISASIILFRKNRNLKPDIHYIRLKEGKSLTNLGLQFFVIQICALVLFTTDNLIISYLYGAADVTPYSTVNKLFTVISSIYTSLLAPIWTATTKAKTEKRWDYLLNIIKKMIIVMIPFVIGAVILAIVFKSLSGLWLGRNLHYTYGLIPLGACYCILTIWCNMISYVANGLELMKVSIILAIIQASGNIPMSLIFARVLNMGIAGILCGTVCSMAISAIIQPIAVFSYIEKKKKEI